jgi:hypothetical protein
MHEKMHSGMENAFQNGKCIPEWKMHSGMENAFRIGKNAFRNGKSIPIGKKSIPE